jgi:LTXXQ motif family protein
MRRLTLERWLPPLSMIIGLFCLAAAAFGQESVPAQSSDAPTLVQHHGNDPGMASHHGMGRGHHSMGRFAGFGSERFCKERFAREAGFLAYIGAKLDLNAQQQPLWGTYHQAMMDAATKQRQACVENILPPDSHLTVLERRDRSQKMLQARLDRLQATRPSLEALYQSLSPEQRRVMDRPVMGARSRR